MEERNPNARRIHAHLYAESIPSNRHISFKESLRSQTDPQARLPPTASAPPASYCPGSLRFPEACRGSLSATADHLVPKDGWRISPDCRGSPCLLEARGLSHRRRTKNCCFDACSLSRYRPNQEFLPLCSSQLSRKVRLLHLICSLLVQNLGLLA